MASLNQAIGNTPVFSRVVRVQGLPFGSAPAHTLHGILLTETQPEEVLSGPENATIAGNSAAQPCLRILETVAEFEELRDAWSAWCASPEADLDFFSIHLRHASGVVRPHVMVVYRNGLADCFLIGWLQQGSVEFKVGSIPLFESHARILRFVDGGFLGNQSLENSRFLMREILRTLQRQDAEAVEFSQVAVTSPLYDLAMREPNIFCREHFAPVQTHRYLTLPGSFDELLRGLSAKSRKQFRGLSRMLTRDFPGRVRFQTVRSEQDVEEFARKAEEISEKTHQRTLRMGFVNNLETRETLRAAAQKAALRACVLHVGHQPVAFASAILSNKTLYGTFTGYDPGFKKYSPGFQTLMHLIEDSFEPRGDVSRFDAGHGDLPYKRRLFASSRKERPVWIFAPSVKGLSLHVRKMVSSLLHSFSMRLLAKSELLRKLKKVWRRQALPKFSSKSFMDIS